MFHSPARRLYQTVYEASHSGTQAYARAAAPRRHRAGFLPVPREARFTDFSGRDLAGNDRSGACFCNARPTDTDLSRVIGMMQQVPA